MSITSCYRYVLELPLATLSQLVSAVFEEPEGGGAAITRRWENVPVSGNTATVEVRPRDPTGSPPIVTLPAAPLAMTIRLDMRLTVDINELPSLDLIAYDLQFDLPGALTKTPTLPPELRLGFPGLTPAMLNLIVSGGSIPLTPPLVEEQVHALYDANPSLATDVQNGVPWPPGPDATVQVTTEVFDDDPGDMPFRGAISVPTITAASLTIRMPGHFKVRGISSTYVDSDMTIDVVVAVQQTDGELRIKLSLVQPADVTVSFTTPPSNPIIAVAAPTILKSAIATKLRTLAPAPSHDVIQPLPTSAEVRALVEGRLVELAAGLSIPVFSPQPPAAPGDIDLTAFEPATVASTVVALQFVPRADGTPCDPPDVFAQADGFSIAIAEVEVRTILDPIVAGALGDRTVEGYDITVDRLDAALADSTENGQTRGHVWIDGTAEVHVDCWADPDIDFAGPIFLVASKSGTDTLVFEADAGQFTAEDDCCADVDPATIANLIEGQPSSAFHIPTEFGGVGEIAWDPGVVEISRAGVIVHCTAAITTATQALFGDNRRIPIWEHEGAGR